MIFLILFLGFISILIVIGIIFIIKAIQKKMSNLLFLGIAFIGPPMGLIFYFVLGFIRIYQEFFIFIGFVCGVIFTNLTFYKDRMKKANFVLIIVIILGLIQILLFHLYGFIEGARTYHYYVRVSLDLPYILLSFNWLAYSCYTAYKRLEDQNIEPWIKMRYKLLAISSFIMSFHNIPEFFQPKNTPWGHADNLISIIIFGIAVIMSMVYVIIACLSWFMPNRLKNYFNGDFIREDDKEYNEDELMDLIKRQLKGK